MGVLSSQNKPAAKPNVVVLGGSYTGLKVAEYLASALHKTHQVIIVEKNTHFQHLFAFPRFSIVPKWEHVAFIPYMTAGMLKPLFIVGEPRPEWWPEDEPLTPVDTISFVRAEATQVLPNKVLLNPRTPGGPKELAYDYLVVTTGTRLPAPGTLATETKPEGIRYFQGLQTKVEKAKEIVIIGGGAVGVQMAADIMDQYPDHSKNVTLVHSRGYLMNWFHPKLSEVILERFGELGVKTVLGARARVPQGGFPMGQGLFDVELNNGSIIKADYVIVATGQLPNSGPLLSLPHPPEDLLTPTGHIRVKPTFQLLYGPSNIFALGDVADTGDQKSARVAWPQSTAVATNVFRMAQHKAKGAPGEPELVGHTSAEEGIHMSLGLRKSVTFRQPKTPDGEPSYTIQEDGEIDLKTTSWVWEMRAPGVKDYYL